MNNQNNTMRKSLFAILIMCIGVLSLSSCKKQLTEDDITISNIIDEARNHFEANENKLLPGEIADLKINQRSSPRKYANHWPRWESAIVKQLSKRDVVIVPIEYSKPFLLTTSLSKNYSYSINQIRKLLIYKDKNGDFQTQAITYIPDSIFLKESKNKFSGIILIEDWKGKLMNLYLVEQNGSIKKSINNTDKFDRKPQGRIQQSATTICIYAEGYNYSADDPEGVHWSELITCETIYPDNNPGSGTQPGGSDYGAIGGGGSSYSVYGNFMIYSPSNPIGDVKDYFKCFINAPGNDYHYQIALCVSQPELGSRTAWESQNPFKDDKNPVYVGHTYLIITQVTPLRTIVRNVGFYPLNGAWPYSPSDRGVLNNDQQRGYDIKLTLTMTSSQFFAVLDYIKQGNNSGYQYNLNTNNCTTFAINALNRAGFNIPATRGTWHNGQGCNPGDLGEDIRSMPLTSNMSRTTTYGTHPNQGTCHPIE